MNEIAPYPQEGLLVDVVAEIAEAAVPVRRVICTSTGLAQFAAAAARLLPGAVVGCTYLDLYRAKFARGHWQDGPANLRIDCAADLVGGERDQAADVVAFPFSASGEAELTRELIQAGHVQLRVGGTMYASTDNPSDTWLGEQLRKIFHGVERRRYAGGALYLATKREQLKKTKNFVCEFAFRDRGG